MWTASELEELSVWADDLQYGGDRWGELVTTSLAAAATSEPEHRESLHQRVAELDRDVLQARVEPILDDIEGIRPIWEHGAMVGLRVIGLPLRSRDAILERLAKLLRLPAARFLWLLRVELWEQGRAVHLDVLPMLLEPEVVARPRVLILGSPIRHVTRKIGIDHLGQAAADVIAPERGLLDLTVDQARIELPWARGDGGSRQQAFERLRARVQRDPTRLSTRDRTALARALWDRSLRVRLAALDLLGTIGVEAAPLIPDLLLINHAHRRWHACANETLAKLAAQPEVVARVAQNFLIEQAGAARWLRTVDQLDPEGLNRIEAMSREARVLPSWLHAELLATLHRFQPQPANHLPNVPIMDVPDLQLGSQGFGEAVCVKPFVKQEPPSLFQRLRSWLRR